MDLWLDVMIISVKHNFIGLCVSHIKLNAFVYQAVAYFTSHRDTLKQKSAENGKDNLMEGRLQAFLVLLRLHG